MALLVTSLRLVVATLLICVVGYTVAILGVARFFPDTAQGSLITAADGKAIGSRLIAQNFTEPGYFWPRPSAAGKEGYDATAAAGSNKSPTSADLSERARQLVARYGATAAKPLPAELAAASGGGLDPHISVQAALYQAERVAGARGLPLSQVEAVIDRHAFAPGDVLTPDRLVDVLEINLALDRLSR
ncbi:potassium-transporting ATPase subunit C [Shumkonia mesophila]|uniref:potassium-transporting ATPase subunit C n=1 Tax=Shumkonia mesophila TaxID=2838854 RepID=UPI002934CB0E|nr:potassium-transporting ATPase subunit C [Shumkonia mesophila]